jgi:hypothetical protein
VERYLAQTDIVLITLKRFDVLSNNWHGYQQMESNKTLILGVTTKGHKVFLRTNLSEIYLDATGKLQCKDSENWSKLLQIGRDAVYEMVDTELLPLFLNEYYKGKASFTFEVEV